MLTDTSGPVGIEVPRDRAGTFEPQIESDLRSGRLRRAPTVGGLMHTPVVSLTAGASLPDVEAQLIESGEPLVLITDGRRVLGTVSPRELAAAVRRRAAGQAIRRYGG